jgi:hypothetical protein
LGQDAILLKEETFQVIAATYVQFQGLGAIKAKD